MAKSIYKFCIYAIIFLNLGFLDIFGVLDRQAMFLSLILGLFAFFVYVFDENKVQILKGKDIILFIFLIVGIFLFQATRIQYPGMTVKAAFTTFAGLLLVLVSFPMYELLQIQFHKTIKYIVNIGFLAIILRIVLWFSYNFMHINLGPGFFKGREDWTRSILGLNLVRISEPYISGFLFIVCILGIYNNGYFKKKVNNIIGIILLYFHAIFVSQTRMQILVYTVILFLMIVFEAFNSKHKGLAIISLLVMIIIFLLNRGYVNSFFNSFDPNSVNGYSTTLRINSFNYFIDEWQNSNIWLGFGFTPDNHMIGLNTYWLSDFGIYINLFEFGIVGFIILILPILKGIIVSVKHIKINAFVVNLFIGLTLFLLISLENIYLLNLTTIVPIYMGLMLLIENNNFISRKQNENLNNYSNF